MKDSGTGTAATTFPSALYLQYDSDEPPEQRLELDLGRQSVARAHQRRVVHQRSQAALLAEPDRVARE